MRFATRVLKGILAKPPIVLTGASLVLASLFLTAGCSDDPVETEPGSPSATQDAEKTEDSPDKDATSDSALAEFTVVDFADVVPDYTETPYCNYALECRAREGWHASFIQVQMLYRGGLSSSVVNSGIVTITEDDVLGCPEVNEYNGLAAEVVASNGAAYPMAVNYADACGGFEYDHVDLVPGSLTTIQLFGFIPDTVPTIEGATLRIALGRFKPFLGAFAPVADLDPGLGASQLTELSVAQGKSLTPDVDPGLVISGETSITGENASQVWRQDLGVSLTSVSIQSIEGEGPFLVLSIRNDSPYDASYVPHGVVYDSNQFVYGIGASPYISPDIPDECRMAPGFTLDCIFSLIPFLAERDSDQTGANVPDFARWMTVLRDSTGDQQTLDRTARDALVFTSE